MDYPDIVKALRCCQQHECPAECPRNINGPSHYCISNLKEEAAKAIEQLIAERNRAYARLCGWCGICSKPTPMRLDTCEIAAIGEEYRDWWDTNNEVHDRET